MDTVAPSLGRLVGLLDLLHSADDVHASNRVDDGKPHADIHGEIKGASKVPM